MNLISRIGYMPVNQTEVVENFRQLAEFISAQQAQNQLIIIIVMILMIFAFVMFFGLRGGFAIFNKLSNAIDRLADIENERHDTQKELVSAVKLFSTQNDMRYQKVDEIWQSVLSGQKEINERIDALQKLYEDNPKDERTYKMLLRIYSALDTAKEQTDEIEVIKTNE